jgi:hypothetical protein
MTNMIVYFYDYKKPPGLPSFTDGLLRPFQAMQFFLSFLGAPLGKEKIPSNLVGTVNNISALANNVNYTVIIIGALLAILFVATWIYLVNQKKNYALIYRMIPWLTIGSYTFISGIITSFGRVGFGVGTSLGLRYMTFSVYLPLALVNLLAIIYDDAQNRGYLLRNRKVFTQMIIGILLATFLYFYMITSNFAIEHIYLVKLDRLQGKACLAFINVVPEEICLTKKLYPDFPNLKPRVKMVQSLQLIDTKFVSSNNIQDIAVNPIDSSNHIEYGAFDNIDKVDNQTFFAGGWAILPEKKEPADAVVLTYETTKDEEIIFAISDSKGKRPDIVEATNTQQYAMSGWEKTFPASRLPKGLVKINAWAFDTETAKAYKLGGTHVVKN